LVRFVEREGHARVPQAHVEDGYRLGQWVSHQRRRRARLTADQARRLAALPGWEWQTASAAWEKGYAQLVRFVEREGHARVPWNNVEGGHRLRQWVTQQRSQRSRLTADQAGRLAALPGWAWHSMSALRDARPI